MLEGVPSQNINHTFSFISKLLFINLGINKLIYVSNFWGPKLANKILEGAELKIIKTFQKCFFFVIWV
jgi:hypothetical protein